MPWKDMLEAYMHITKLKRQPRKSIYHTDPNYNTFWQWQNSGNSNGRYEEDF